MTYKFEDELRAKAEDLIAAIVQAGVDVELSPVMYRDYMVKIAVGKHGHIIIYYSSKNQSFSLKTHELRAKALVSQIKACWSTLGDDTEKPSTTTEFQAYVDGSFIQGSVGYGAVIIKDDQALVKLCGPVDQYTDHRQVAGELQAVITVLQWCHENGVEEIEIVFDYEGIEKWVTGEWGANIEATQHYVAAVQQSPVKIIWRKVKSHTGDRWNEVADSLARKGALGKEGSDES